jgi:hypothetical protein
VPLMAACLEQCDLLKRRFYKVSIPAGITALRSATCVARRLLEHKPHFVTGRISDGNVSFVVLVWP